MAEAEFEFNTKGMTGASGELAENVEQLRKHVEIFFEEMDSLIGNSDRNVVLRGPKADTFKQTVINPKKAQFKAVCDEVDGFCKNLEEQSMNLNRFNQGGR